MTALQKKLRNLGSTIEDETQRLLKKRQIELDVLAKSYEPSIEAGRSELTHLMAEIDDARQALLAPKLELAGVQAEIDHLMLKDKELKHAIESQHSQLNVAGQTLNATKAQAEYLTNLIEPLKTQLGDLTGDKQYLEEEITKLKLKQKSIEDKYAIDLRTFNNDVNQLMAQKDELAVWMIDRKREIDLALKAAGDRQLAQDAMDRTLRDREMKINQDQRIIARNANLLNL